MEKLHFSIVIKAPKQKVWETMLNDKTYRQWTDVFHAGSYFEGDWSAGSNIRFLGPDEGGTVSGMFGQVRESDPYNFVSVAYFGEIIRGKENLWSKVDTGDVEPQENYTFNEVDGGTELLIDLDTNEEFKEMFQGMWPKALEKLKALAEAN